MTSIGLAAGSQAYDGPARMIPGDRGQELTAYDGVYGNPTYIVTFPAESRFEPPSPSFKGCVMCAVPVVTPPPPSPAPVAEPFTAGLVMLALALGLICTRRRSKCAS